MVRSIVRRFFWSSLSSRTYERKSSGLVWSALLPLARISFNVELAGVDLTGVRFSTTFGFMSSVLSIGAKCSSTDEGEEDVESDGGVVEQRDKCCCTLLLYDSGESRPVLLAGTVQSAHCVPLLSSGLIALNVFIKGDVF